MVSSIQISQETKSELDALKFRGETYEDVILDLIEDRQMLSQETQEAIKIARKEYDSGDVISHEDFKKELGL